VADRISQPLLEVKNLKTYFFTEDGVVKAVDGVDFTVNRVRCWVGGRVGCGKSVTSFSIMRLVGVPGKMWKVKSGLRAKTAQAA